jgi:hypothetical protein
MTRLQRSRCRMIFVLIHRISFDAGDAREIPRPAAAPPPAEAEGLPESTGLRDDAEEDTFSPGIKMHQDVKRYLFAYFSAPMKCNET